MRKRIWGLMVLALFSSVFLAGCNDPDKNFQKGDYAKAYPEFVKRAGTNEVTLRNEAANGTFEPRQKAGNQAVHDLFYAAECQKKLGNNAEAEALYRRVVALSQYQIRIPHDQSALLKDSLFSLISSAREVRSQETSYGRALSDWRNQPPPGNTDPYDNGGSNGGTTTEAPSRYWLANAVLNLRTRQRDYVRLLFATTADQVPDIAKVKTAYDKFSRSLDNYLSYGAPGSILFSPDSFFSQIAWSSFESGLDTFQRVAYAAQGNVTYTTQALQLKKPQLIDQAKAALASMGVSPALGVEAPAGAGQGTTGTNGVNVNSSSNSPFVE